MPDDAPTRRDFLTGHAVRQELAQRGDALADVVVDASEGRTEPAAGDTIRLETRAMGCPWCVIMEPGPPEQVLKASAALEVVHALDAQLSVYQEESEVSRLNRRAADEPQRVEEGLFQLLIECRRLTDETSGAFDAAARALILLWRRCRQAGRLPDEAEINVARSMSGMQHVALDEESLNVQFARPGVGLDFGAIGKGHAIDRGDAALREQGLQNFLLHGGHSSLLARGTHHGLAGWPVGIKNPLFTEQRYATLLLRDRAMSTSGSNIQYFRHQGRRYGHILDPRTGWPAEGLLSVTVLAETAAEADALSTAFYVMGLEKALDYCDNHPLIGALLIPPPQGRTLEPVVRNIADEVLFLAGDEA